MAIARPINLNVSCKSHPYTLQRTQSPSGPRLPKRIGNTHPCNYHNLTGKDIDVHFLFIQVNCESTVSKVGLMSLNHAILNARGLKDPSKCACLLGELWNLCLNVSAVQETHFICAEDCRVLRDDFEVFSAFGSRCSARVFLLVGHSLNVIVNLVFPGNGPVGCS